MMIFTASQWQELELQALIFKYMASGTPVPSDLILGVRRSLPTDPLLLQPIPSPKAADPEPGRCRRTDGKKWRCSREAYANSKYCERHMHRGRSRSRKPVELLPPPPPPPPPLSLPSPHALNLPLSSSSSRPAPQVDSHREDVSDFNARKAAKLLCFLEERSPKVGTSWMDLDVDPLRISLEHEETSLHLNFNGKS